MSTEQVNYILNITGNATGMLNKMGVGVNNLNKSIKQTTSLFANFSTKVVAFNQFAQSLQGLSASLMQGSKNSLDFEQSIADLSAITGIAGKDLKELEKVSRETGKSSGLGATQAADAFKTLACCELVSNCIFDVLIFTICGLFHDK